jgi:hypothetical protein
MKGFYIHDSHVVFAVFHLYLYSKTFDRPLMVIPLG